MGPAICSHRPLSLQMTMPDEKYSLARSMEYFQKMVREAGPSAAAAYTLTGAILLLGGIGYALDWFLGWTPYGLISGLILGIIVGFYELVKLVYKSH